MSGRGEVCSSTGIALDLLTTSEAGYARISRSSSLLRSHLHVIFTAEPPPPSPLLRYAPVSFSCSLLLSHIPYLSSVSLPSPCLFSFRFPSPFPLPCYAPISLASSSLGPHFLYLPISFTSSWLQCHLFCPSPISVSRKPPRRMGHSFFTKGQSSDPGGGAWCPNAGETAQVRGGRWTVPGDPRLDVRAGYPVGDLMTKFECIAWQPGGTR